MVSVQEHYDTHLGPLYTWMSGGAASARQRFTDWWQSLALPPIQPGAQALDLGAGNGFQTLPLAQAGYVVTALDLSAVLLAELSREAIAANLPVRIIHGDLRELKRHCPKPAPALIVCMGDTLTHLPSLSDVDLVLRDVADVLAPGGHCLLTFRDYTVERTGADRFIPVRSEDDRIFTCFLEFGPTHLAVHDLVQSRTAAGWKTAISVYQKLRLAPSWVEERLLAAGLTVIKNVSQNGLVTLVAHRSLLS